MMTQMRRRLSLSPVLAALSAATALAPAGLAQTVHLMVGTYTYTGDTIFRNIVIDPDPMNPGQRTLTLLVIGGRAVFTGGTDGDWAINGKGADGTPGIDGNVYTSFDPTPGGDAGLPFNLVVETLPGNNSSCNIEIGGSINCSGGNGGNGGNGSDELRSGCDIFGPPQTGQSAGHSTAGGNISLYSSGAISISHYVTADGGSGGNGGRAGAGLIHPAGSSAPGTSGSDGGVITIAHTQYAPADASVSMGITATIPYSGVHADGGIGGDGGSGASGSGGSSAGSNAGNGGNGGTVTFTCNNLSLSSSVLGVGCSAAASGAQAGQGGAGADAHGSSCYTAPFCTFAYDVAACAATAAGNGGNGGNGGSVAATIRTSATFGQSCGLYADGGLGGPARIAGSGSVETYATCEDAPDCNAFTLLDAVAAAISGKGGKGGVVTVSAQALAFGRNGMYYSGLSVIGGTGADGAPAAHPGLYCCPENVPHTGAGLTGGAGGKGGDGGTIKISYSAVDLSGAIFSLCGGPGGTGGDGSYGVPTGAGGSGGTWGGGGKLYKNGVLQTTLCGIGLPRNGQPGGDLPPCINP